jgi:hypothetical protein
MGATLVSKGQAPGAYSDILIVEDDNERVVKPVMPPDKLRASSPEARK